MAFRSTILIFCIAIPPGNAEGVVTLIRGHTEGTVRDMLLHYPLQVVGEQRASTLESEEPSGKGGGLEVLEDNSPRIQSVL